MESRYLQAFLSPSEAVSGLENMQAIDGDVPKQQSFGFFGAIWWQGMIPVIVTIIPATPKKNHPATLIKHQKAFFIVDN